MSAGFERALGMEGISKSQVSRVCAELDAGVKRSPTRRLDGSYPYLRLDATFRPNQHTDRLRSGQAGGR
jgi:transposase-like protein